MNDVTLRAYAEGKADAQQVLDFVYAKLKEQGRPSTIGKSCAYNGADGTHCAIGWLVINEDGFDPREGESYDLIAQQLGLRLKRGQHHFLGELQEAHDNSTGPNFLTALQFELTGVAENHGLKVLF